MEITNKKIGGFYKSLQKLGMEPKLDMLVRIRIAKLLRQVEAQNKLYDDMSMALINKYCDFDEVSKLPISNDKGEYTVKKEYTAQFTEEFEILETQAEKYEFEKLTLEDIKETGIDSNDMLKLHQILDFM